MLIYQLHLPNHRTYMQGSWSIISLVFLLVIALVGTALRLAPLVKFPLPYEYLLHAHSHTAFQGWVYTAMMLLLVNRFFSKEQLPSGKYALQFKATVVVVVGGLISFAMQGYGLYSIICSTFAGTLVSR